MKNSLFFLSVVLLYSCGKKESSKDYSQLEISIDTVMVDSKDEILYLQMGLRWSDVSMDRKFFYNFDMNRHKLEIINLDKLELEKIVNFDKEGPNGTGARFTDLKSIGQDSLYLSSQFTHDVFDLNGKKLVSSSTRDQQYSGDDFNEGESFSHSVLSANNPHLVFGWGKNWRTGEVSFIQIDFIKNYLQKWKIPAFEILQSFHYEMETPKVWFGTSNYTSIVENKVLLSNGVSSDIYVYDIPSEMLELKSPSPSLTEKEKTKLPPKMVAGIEENREVSKMLKEQINFLHPIWDNKSKLFYRFSFEEVIADRDESDEVVNTANIFLTVLDEGFTVIAEKAIPTLKHIPYRAFVKDESIWISINIEDELGFLRIKVI
ncbi:DUF4221 domain-containing protein [Belliella sp. DSM 111904]|uniref:DUF4221 domain-containing protein n=1 Tax=Belliella filtrata TaxID=2923435 RepID=A0ABS9V3G9_9BACT|nr:DUF4221 family protein [Belliella filtrata]MCH7410946.1 DUF4221 domain-containing protein [Belliella filtrata]